LEICQECSGTVFGLFLMRRDAIQINHVFINRESIQFYLVFSLLEKLNVIVTTSGWKSRETVKELEMQNYYL
jgi:hypothetical protein